MLIIQLKRLLHFSWACVKYVLCTVLHRNTFVWQSQLPASGMAVTATGAAITATDATIKTYRRGHRNLPAWPSEPTSRLSLPTGVAIEIYRRGHRNLPARQFIITGAGLVVSGAAWDRFKNQQPRYKKKVLCMYACMHVCMNACIYFISYMYLYSHLIQGSHTLY